MVSASATVPTYSKQTIFEHCTLIRAACTSTIPSSPHLSRCCAISSMALATYLKSFGHRVQVVQGLFDKTVPLAFNPLEYINHTWVELERTYSLDITTSQFSSRGAHFPEILIQKIPSNLYEPIIRSDPENYTAFEAWPEDQQPTQVLTSRILASALNPVL